MARVWIFLSSAREIEEETKNIEEKHRKKTEKNNENQQKRRFWRSYEKMDVTIKFYMRNYPV